MLHAIGEAEEILTVLADQDRMPWRTAEANLLLAEVNAHLESLDHWSPHQHGSVARNQVALDGAEAVVQHHWKVHRPASLRGSVTTKVELPVTAGKPDGVDRVVQGTQVVQVALERSIAAEES